MPTNYKQAVLNHVKDCDGFDHSGLTLELLTAKEFYAGHQIVSTTHEQWGPLFTTSERSCLLTFNWFLRRRKGTCNTTAAQYKTAHIKFTTWTNLRMGVLARAGVGESVLAKQEEKVMKSVYDDELDSLTQDLNEDVDDLTALDKHLSQYQIVVDSVELQTVVAQGVATQETSVHAEDGNMDDDEWFISELTHEAKKFKQLSSVDEAAAAKLEAEEQKYAKVCRENAKQAAKPLTELRAVMLPHTADHDAFLLKLTAQTQDMLEKISKAENCAPSDAYVVYVRDFQSTGVATNRCKDQAVASASAFCGAKGLALFLASSVPSGKGRATVATPKEAGAKGAEAPKQDAGTSDLPVAPSSVEEYADNAKVKALLAEDFVSLMKLGACVPGRYTDVCFFRSASAAHYRGVINVPSTPSLWQRMRLCSGSEISGFHDADDFLDTSGPLAKRARAGECVRVTASRLKKKSDRDQRGPSFYKAFLEDLEATAESCKQEFMKPCPILIFFDECWDASNAMAFVHFILDRLKEASTKPKLYALFHDRNEGQHLACKAIIDQQIQKRYMEGTYVASGFAPPKVPDDLTALRAASGKSLNQEDFKHIKFHQNDGKTYAVLPTPQQVQVHLSEGPLKRLRDMISSHQIPAKKLKLTSDSINAPGVQFPLRAQLAALVGTFQVVQSAAPIPGFKLLLMESREHAGVYIQYLHNVSGERRTLEAGTHIMSGGPGVYLDLKKDADAAKLRAGAAYFAWDLKASSLFFPVFAAPGLSKPLDFQEMMEKARTACGTKRVEVYAHNVADSQQAGSVATMRSVPRVRGVAEVALQLGALPAEKFNQETAGNFLLDRVVVKEGILTKAWCVALREDRVEPLRKDGSACIMFVVAKPLIIDNQECAAITVCT